MQYKTTEEIRSGFLKYFEDHGHRVHSSHALIPPDDPTLLFINAGMVQFKDCFTGLRKMDPPRATSSQKCLRVSGKHNDLENVGRTARHHTFFEMLGNFSFGAYFKREAIVRAWEFLTSKEHLGVPVDDLWVTVHPDDDEAREIWVEEIGVATDRVLDDPENFWSMGDTGPCGPCSEIHIDQGAELSGGVEVSFGEGGDRYLELWNLVFMQFDRDASGTLTPLPSPSIDTGMGLERVAAIVQGKQSNYDIDSFKSLIGTVERLSGKTYLARFSDPNSRDPETEEDVAFRVIADHGRATAFLIADGIYPENEGRGYVLRRVMRRAIRFGRKLGMEGGFFAAVCDEVVQEMGRAFPELGIARAVIERVVQQEEERFGRTLVEGCRLLENAIDEVQASGGSEVSGEVVFTLCDTHGFPVDLTRLIAEERDIAIDEAGFEAAMEAQRERGRSSWQGAGAEDDQVFRALHEQGLATEFVGYEAIEIESEVIALIADGAVSEAVEAGSKADVLTRQTPFYAEAGGQVGDVGTIAWASGHGAVVDTQSGAGQLTAHRVCVEKGTLKVGDAVTLSVTGVDRESTRRNHSATHLMHWALGKVLGDHVKQRGSLVAPNRLRFDFSHFNPMTSDELVQVETLVNQRVLGNQPVQTAEMAYDSAIEAGATAFFGEKYGDEVRVVSITDSVELCGGTHVAATGDIGLFKIVSEGGVSSGVRRIEALTGSGALDWVHGVEQDRRDLARDLKVDPLNLREKIAKVLRQLQDAQQENGKLRAQMASSMAGDASDEIEEIGGVKVLVMQMSGISGKDLRTMSDTARDRIGSGVVLLASDCEGKVGLLVGVTSDLEGKVHAGNIISEIAPLVGGRGGGRADLAQAGGNDPSGIPQAVERFRTLLEAS
jgi:alanyl-tRNA synthetase